MTHTFQATLLLDRPWGLDPDAIAAALHAAYPQIGRVESLPTSGGARDTGLLSIDNARVSLEVSAMPMLASEMTPALKTLRTWDPDEVIRSHRAQLTVTCGEEDLAGLDGAKAYAAACHFVATAAASVAPAKGVFWHQGWALTSAEMFREMTDGLLKGRMPILSWISFATIVPEGQAPNTAAGMVTYGLRPFIGRELELAPRLAKPHIAFRILNGVVREILENGAHLTDGMTLRYPSNDLTLTVRARRQWLRQGVPAFVLVAEDSLIDTKTLRPHETTGI